MMKTAVWLSLVGSAAAVRMSDMNIDALDLHHDHNEDEASLVNRTDEEGFVLPDCFMSYTLDEFVRKAAAWCDPKLVATEHRVPHKLQGLYWIKGSWLDDVAICFSTGRWDPKKRTLKLKAYRDVVYIDRFASLPLGGRPHALAAWFAQREFHVTFKDDSLTEAEWRPFAGGNIVTNAYGKAANVLEDWLTSFKIVQDDSAPPGDKWTRPSWLGMWPLKLSTGEFDLWRVMDGGLTVKQDWADLMYRYFYEAAGYDGVFRYYDKGESVFSMLKWCPGDPELAPAVKCPVGVHVAVTHQPKFGLRHFVPTSTPVTFARTALGDEGECVLDYQIKCDSAGQVFVEEVKRCDKNAVNSVLIHSASGRSGALRTPWKVCARPLVHYSLNLTTQLIDLTWDTPLGADDDNVPLYGCVELWMPDHYQHLSNVRGTFAQQRNALVARKKQVGGCPTFLNDDDRKARGGSFMRRHSLDIMGTADEGSSIDSLGPWMVALQYANGWKASNWHDNIARWSTRESWMGTIKGLAADVATFGLMAGFYGISMSMNHTTAAMAFAEVNCGMPAPFLEGPQKFRHAEVVAITAANQTRAYATATVLQVEECFDETGPLFQTSGLGPHNEWRKVFDYAFSEDNFQAPVYKEDVEKPHTWTPASKLPSLSEIGSLVLPVLLKNVFKLDATDADMAQILPYLDKGRMCNLGTVGSTLAAATFSRSTIIAAREAMAEFAARSEVGQHIIRMADSGELAELNQVLEMRKNLRAHKYELDRQEVPPRYQSAANLLMQDFADIVLFKGLLDTVDMVDKCVRYQWRDHRHRRLFLKDNTTYLEELMRFDGTPSAFTAAFSESTVLQMEGKEVTFPAGVPVQYVLATANRDPAVFGNASSFEPTREELKNMVSWGGRLEDVKNRNTRNAPRHCPAYKLSMDIAKAVCAHLTHELDAYDGKRGKETRTGRVRIVKAGDKNNGAEGIIVHSVRESFKGTQGLMDAAYRLGKGASVLFGSWCVMNTATYELMGCYKQTELKMDDNAMTSMQDSTVSLEDEAKKCPRWIPSYLENFAEWAFNDNPITGDDSLLSTKRFKSFAFDVAFGTEMVGKLTRDWADRYTVGLYSSITRMVSRYTPRGAGDVPVPTHMGVTSMLSLGSISVPTMDMDFPTFLPAESLVPKYLYEVSGGNSFYFPTFNCLQDSLRTIMDSPFHIVHTGKSWSASAAEFDDHITTEGENVWPTLLQRGGHDRKKEWMVEFFKVGQEGSVWPAPANDLEHRYFKRVAAGHGGYEDTLERAMAFRLIGTHRVKPIKEAIVLTGDIALDATLKYSLEADALKGLTARKGFGAPGSTMYFDAEGNPKVISNNHHIIKPGDENWHMEKFIWRSSLLLSVTIEDHHMMTHYRVANELASSARDALPPNHPMRRLLSIFTYGTIFANVNSLHVLMGNNQLLHRASSLSDLEYAHRAGRRWGEDLVETHEAFFSEEKYNALGDELKKAPYYTDGKLLFNALRTYIHKFMERFHEEFCMKGTSKLNGKMNVNDDIYQFAKRLAKTTNAKSRRRPTSFKDVDWTCEEFAEDLTAAIWTVTGFHRHVSDIADFLLDPDVASFSWVQGEAAPRPRQHVIGSLIVPLMNTPQPTLIPSTDGRQKVQDYSYIFDDIEHDADAKNLWTQFHNELVKVSETIVATNKQRKQVGELFYWSADPKRVEIAAAS